MQRLHSTSSHSRIMSSVWNSRGARRWRQSAVMPISLVLASCSPESTPVEPGVPDRPAPTIADAAHNAGSPHFYFLPPLVAKPRHTGTPDGSAAPEVLICEWDANACVDLVAAFDETTGTGSEVIVYNATDGQYQVNWHTDRCVTGACSLDPSKVYRLRVMAGAVELGHADLDVATTGREIKSAETSEMIGLVNGRTLPIAFRIEQGAITRVGVGGGATIGSAGGSITTADGRVGLNVPAGALGSPTAISIDAATGLPTLGDHASPVDLGPDGQTFHVPVLLTLGFDPDKLPEGVPPSALRLVTWNVDHWEEVPGAVLNEFDNTISAPISHFSFYAVSIAPNTVSGTGAATLLVGQTTTYSATVSYAVPQGARYCFTHRHGLRSVTHCHTQLTHVYYPVSGVRVEWSTQHSGIALFSSPGYSVTNGGVAVSPLLTATGAGGTWVMAATPGFGSGSSLSPLLVQATITPLFDQLATGRFHGCVIDSSGITQCWGSRGFAAVGDGQPQSTAVTTRVSVAGNPPPFVQVTSHGQHSCGGTSAGAWYCWGRNSQGVALGNNGNPSLVTSPTLLNHGPYQYVSGGILSACALTAQGTTFCWGINQLGEVGDGTTTSRFAPTLVATPLQFSSIEASWLHSCGLTVAGEAHCWGAWQGQLLQQFATHTPAPIPGGHVFTRLFSGGTHTCGIDAQHRAWCWGDNTSGQLGDGTTTGGGTPVLVQGGHFFAAIAVGIYTNVGGAGHTCGLTILGAVYCWGLNDRGQLGDGTTTDRPAPTAVVSNEVFVGIAAGTAFTCALTPDRRVFCWGTNANGELGSGVAGGISATPVQVP